MGSRRVSSYNSRATRRTAGSGSKKRSGSRTALTGQTTGAQPGAYSRCHSFIASSSPVIRPDAASMRRARPVDCAMLPRWPSSTLFAPSSIGCRSAAPVRIASTKLAMCRAVISSSAVVLRVAHAQRPARDVDLVRAVVQDLARSPAPEPMPIVVNDVVVVRGTGRRALPQLVVQVRRNGHRLPAADRASRVGVPGAREIGLPDGASLDRLHDVDRAWRGALLRSHLYDAAMLALRFDEQFAFARVVPARLLHVDVLPRLHRKHGAWRLPALLRRDHQCV